MPLQQYVQLVVLSVLIELLRSLSLSLAAYIFQLFFFFCFSLTCWNELQKDMQRQNLSPALLPALALVACTFSQGMAFTEACKFARFLLPEFSR